MLRFCLKNYYSFSFTLCLSHDNHEVLISQIRHMTGNVITYQKVVLYWSWTLLLCERSMFHCATYPSQPPPGKSLRVLIIDGCVIFTAAARRCRRVRRMCWYIFAAVTKNLLKPWWCHCCNQVLMSCAWRDIYQNAISTGTCGSGGHYFTIFQEKSAIHHLDAIATDTCYITGAISSDAPVGHMRG